MTYAIKKLYNKYFQKSKSFLLPILGIKKNVVYPPINSYLIWENVYILKDHRLILTYYVREDIKWNQYLLNILMSNTLFDEYVETEDANILAVTFDFESLKDDYDHVVEGRYSKLSKETKTKIRNFYGYNSPEWGYLESFLYPDKYIPTYSRLLDVDTVHIEHTGQLCDKPNIDKETLKLKPNEKHDDVNPLDVEQGKDYQANSDAN